MSLSEIERTAIQTCCDQNDNLTLNVHEKDNLYVYKSRFFEVDFNKKYIIIDQPSPDTHNAKPLAKGDSFEVFFEYKTFRYLFIAKILDHTMFKSPMQEFHAIKISIPLELQDGDKREYFRVQTGMRPPIAVKFNLFPRDMKLPVMSAIMADQLAEFHSEMVDLSGGGFAMREKPGEKNIKLEKGDIILAHFKLKTGFEEMELWAEVRNYRKYKDTDITVWGLQFLGKEKNNNLNYCRNKIMRYVTERQREILSR